MTVLVPNALAHWHRSWSRSEVQNFVVSVFLLAFIGVELAVLASWLPDTLEQWWSPSGTGDFGNFYEDAKNLNINGIYSPGLSLILYPIAWFSLQDSYRVFVGLGGVAVLAVAYLAQRTISSPEGKIAMALGVISVPQLHWALRLGHMTAFLALAALGGFMLVRKHPILAGLCFAVLVLKPQYAPIPALYLLWTRNGKALASMAIGVLVIELVGFTAVGFTSIGPYIGVFFDLSADSFATNSGVLATPDLALGGRDLRHLLPFQRSWQYAWQGFLISANIEPKALLVIGLSTLSLGAVVLAWARGSRAAAPAAAAFGMLIITPYANFYDWGLLVVAGALLLRAELPWKALAPLMLVALYFGLLAAQEATPFPPTSLWLGALVEANGTLSRLGDLDVNPTSGIYWITPMVLGAVFLLAFVGNKGGQADGREPATATPLSEFVPWHHLQRWSWLGLAMLVVPLAYFASAFYGGTPPFERASVPRAEVEKQVPEDFPLPEGAKLVSAEFTESNLYYVEWTSDASVGEIVPLYEQLLGSPGWELTREDEPDPPYRIRLAKFSPLGFMTHWGNLEVAESENGSAISLEFFKSQLLNVNSDVEPESP